MRQLNGVYTQSINRAHGRVGHVFQGRYKSILIEKDSYLLEPARYVVLNPLRAGMINEIGDWPWSSYLAMIGAVPTPVWLQTDWLMGQFDQQRERAREKYMDFVRAGVGLPSLWADLRNQVFLGSEGFVARMHAAVSHEQSLDEIPRIQRRLPAKSLDSYREEQVNNLRLGMALAYLSGDYSMKAIADEFGVHYTTVSRAVKEHDSKNLL